MNMPLAHRIRENMKTFSKGQKKIAQYVLLHPETAADMTAVKLAMAVGASESTVVRFAAELGYSGYPAFQRAIQEMIKNQLTSVQRMNLIPKTQNELFSTILNQDMNAIEVALSEISQEDFAKAVEAVSNAEKVYVVATRSSVALATFLVYYLNLLLDDVHFLNVSSEVDLFEQIIRVNENDAVFCMNFPRYSTKIAKAVHYVKGVGANVVVLTDSENSPIADAASELLIAQSTMASFVDSLVAPMSVVNAFLAAVAQYKHKEVEEVFNRLENIWDEYGVYEKVDTKLSEKV